MANSVTGLDANNAPTIAEIPAGGTNETKACQWSMDTPNDSTIPFVDVRGRKNITLMNWTADGASYSFGIQWSPDGTTVGGNLPIDAITAAALTPLDFPLSWIRPYPTVLSGGHLQVKGVFR